MKGTGSWIVWLGTALLALPGCEVGRDASDGDDGEAVRSDVVVDTVFAVEEEIRRFQATLGEAPTGLSGGAPSRDELVSRFVRAVEAADTLAFGPLLMTRAEFGYLYYPHTMFAAPPYMLPPEILWLQMENTTGRGFGRLRDRLFGRPLRSTGYSCEADPEVQGGNRIWNECRLRIAPVGEEPYDLRLFGSILEREGVFKFVSYASDL